MKTSSKRYVCARVVTNAGIRPTQLSIWSRAFWFLVLLIGSCYSWQEAFDVSGSMSIDKKANVVVIYKSDPSDTSTFMSYVDFATGLSQRYPDGQFSLLTYSKEEDRFFVHFSQLTGTNLSLDVWRSRANVSTNKSEADRLLYDPKVIVSLDVDISEKVPICKKINQSSTIENYVGEIVVKKCYHIFTHSFSLTKENDTCNQSTRKKYVVLPAFIFRKLQGLSMSKKIFFCNVSQFYYEQKSFYDDVDYREASYFLKKPNCHDKSGVCYKGYRYSGKYMAHHFYEQKEVNNKWSVTTDYSGTRWNWYEAKSFCSTLGLTLAIVNNQQKLKKLYKLLIFEDFLYERHRKFPIKLSRRPRKPGQRFGYTDNKDLRFANWGYGEPKGANSRNCVGHHVAYIRSYLISFKSYGWFTSGCGHKVFDTIICHSKTQPKPSELKLASENSLGHTDLLSRSKLGTEDIQLNILADGRNELRSLFHNCKAEQENSSTLMVPLVYLCDGKLDCPSGSDESYCGRFGIASCSSKHWMCKSRQCVPLAARCDLIQDCQDGSDEMDCGFKCHHGMCGSGRCLPKPWFNDGQEDCGDGDDESGQYFTREACVFLCNRTQCVTRAMLNDSVVDCKGPEGPLDETLGALESMNCTNQRGNPIINNWAPRCVLVRDMFGEIIGCRYFQHLKSCENFTCPPGYVKCPSSFCIPLSYVADGKDDCYDGEDELSPILQDLDLSVLKCSLSGMQSVALSAVCDGRKDCKNGEDEIGCGISCLPGFDCVAGAVSVSRYNISSALLDLSFVHDQTRYLDLSGVDVNNFFHAFPPDHLTHLLTLKLSNSNIRSVWIKPEVEGHHGNNLVCTNSINSHDFKSVQTLDLSFNKIKSLPPCSYISLMAGLRDLNVSHNYQLTELSKDFFRGFFELTTLDLSFTAIKTVAQDQFQDLVSLETLYLQHSKLTIIDFVVPTNVGRFSVEGLNIKHVGRDLLKKVASIKEIHSPTYKLCCPQVLGHKTSKHVCYFPPSQHLSCNNMVEEVFLRSLIWLVSLSIIAGNTATLVYRLFWEKQFLNKPFGLYVTNLGVSDLLMGVYLLIIGVADASSQGEYVLHDFIWRNSFTCCIAGTIATLSSLTSSLFLMLITLERYLAVRYPFGEVRLSSKTITIAVVAVWLFGICFASLPFLPFANNWVIYSNSGMCIGLPLDSRRISGWQFSATQFIGFNLLFFIIIGIGQASIFKIIREKGKRIKKTSNKDSQLRANQRNQEFAIAKQLSIVVLTDFACLFPIIAMGLMAMLGQDVGQAAYRWIAVIFVPINSALNPLLYTLPAIKNKWEKYRIDRQKLKRATRAEANKQRIQKGEYRVGILTAQQRMQVAYVSYKRLRKLRQTLISRVQTRKVCIRDLDNLRSRVIAVASFCRELLR